MSTEFGYFFTPSDSRSERQRLDAYPRERRLDRNRPSVWKCCPRRMPSWPDLCLPTPSQFVRYLVPAHEPVRPVGLGVQEDWQEPDNKQPRLGFDLTLQPRSGTRPQNRREGHCPPLKSGQVLSEDQDLARRRGAVLLWNIKRSRILRRTWSRHGLFKPMVPFLGAEVVHLIADAVFEGAVAPASRIREENRICTGRWPHDWSR